VNAPGSLLWRRGADSTTTSARPVGSRRAPTAACQRAVRERRCTDPPEVLFISSKPTPGPGSEVFVPMRPPGEKINAIALLGGIAQILSSVVAVVVVLRR